MFAHQHSGCGNEIPRNHAQTFFAIHKRHTHRLYDRAHACRVRKAAGWFDTDQRVDDALSSVRKDATPVDGYTHSEAVIRTPAH